MALKTIAETNKAPVKSTKKGLVVIPFRFTTAAANPITCVCPRPDAGATISVSRTSSTVYVVTIPQIRSAPATTGTGGALENMAQIEVDSETAEYVSSAVFAAVSTNNTTTCTLTFNSAPANGTIIRCVIRANMVGLQ